MTTVTTAHTAETLFAKLEHDPGPLDFALTVAEEAIGDWIRMTPTTASEDVPNGWIGGHVRDVIDELTGYEEFILMDDETVTAGALDPSPEDHTGTLGALIRAALTAAR